MTIKEFEIQYALGSLSRDMIIALAESKKTSKKILTILSKNKDWGIRCRVAYNSNTPVNVLAILFADDDWSVKYAVSKNPNALNWME